MITNFPVRVTIDIYYNSFPWECHHTTMTDYYASDPSTATVFADLMIYEMKHNCAYIHILYCEDWVFLHGLLYQVMFGNNFRKIKSFVFSTTQYYAYALNDFSFAYDKKYEVKKGKLFTCFQV